MDRQAATWENGKLLFQLNLEGFFVILFSVMHTFAANSLVFLHKNQLF